jgi:biopolymer transport protein ExbB/biopolymer transport protein TolQ
MVVEQLLHIALLGSSWVMYLLLGLSVVSLAAVVERIWYFKGRQRAAEELGDKVIELLIEHDQSSVDALLGSNTSVESVVLRRALRWLGAGPEAFMDAVDAELSRARRDLDRGMTLLGTLGSNAPFIGLFGTVIGVIEAFHQLGAGQDKAAMGNVMSGIAEALVATGVGLFVAIPAVVAYNVLQKKVEEVETNIAGIAKRICTVIRGRERGFEPRPDPKPADENGAVGQGASEDRGSTRSRKPLEAAPLEVEAPVAPVRAVSSAEG